MLSCHMQSHQVLPHRCCLLLHFHKFIIVNVINVTTTTLWPLLLLLLLVGPCVISLLLFALRTRWVHKLWQLCTHCLKLHLHQCTIHNTCVNTYVVPKRWICPSVVVAQHQLM